MSRLTTCTLQLAHRKQLLLLLLCAIVASCSVDSYETGDNEYSYMRADFGIAYTNGKAAVEYATNDNDDRIDFEEAATASWITTPDSAYRALIYYNKVGEKAECISLSRVLTLIPKEAGELSEIHSDPLMFESAWVSSNKSFVNIGFAVKTGQVDGNFLAQEIGICVDSVVTKTGGERHYYMQMTHKQNGSPEYYSSKGFASIQIKSEYRGAILHLSIPTYNGKTEKILSL